MTKRMLIDASHAEETRVVMLDGNRLEEYDVETAAKKQLKGNIYLAKVVRVEPSLQAAFIEYGGNRHGFLAFGEIHPDYYQIPVADRQRLLALQEEEAEAERAAEEAETREAADAGEAPAEPEAAADPEPAQPEPAQPESAQPESAQPESAQPESAQPEPTVALAEPEPPAEPQAIPLAMAPEPTVTEGPAGEIVTDAPDPAEITEPAPETPAETASETPPETIEGPAYSNFERDDREERRTSQRLMRHYKIQEVIRRRQILLVQVVKEERGTKGAALTTYISLAGRFCVLMPNSPRGGGVSRKITSAADRKRLKEITAELDIPKGMAMIVRTAGAQRPRPEIRRDCEYLLRLWDDIRDTTLASIAPSLIYEEANLIKRAIRDVYSSDVEEILVDGEEGWRAARGFMRMLMPANASKVRLWREAQPLFARQNVEGFLDAMMSPSVQLRSGGYLVINQTEALVAIDVNSGRSTRERGIEETALRTNLEAADEVARQLRLRDLAGLIVIDFIDMESRRHNAMVERRLKDALRQDRARIQVGDISHFGLMEMSRQRLRPSLVENSFVACEHCNGTGLVRGVESASLHVLRAIEVAGGPRDAAEIAVHVPTAIALYILNHKREWLAEIEHRCVMQVTFETDDSLQPPAHRIVRTQVRSPAEIPAGPPPRTVEIEAGAGDDVDEPESDAPLADASLSDRPVIDEPGLEDDVSPGAADNPQTAEAYEAAEGGEEADRKRRRRRRRRRGERREDGTIPIIEEAPVIEEAAAETLARTASDLPAPVETSVEAPGESFDKVAELSGEEPPRSRRGRRSRRRRPDEVTEIPVTDGPPPAPYAGPTPADPFGGAFDIFDALAQDEDRYVVNTQSSAASIADSSGIADPVVEPAAEPEPTPEEPAPVSEPEPEPEPAIKPILVGTAEPPARRSGWWKR